ncbi:MAG: type II secretion system F family protein [Sporichthyaceae bacterium]
MRRLLRLGSFAMCVAAVLVGTGGPAAAAANGRIVAITSAEGTVEMVFQASELPPGQSVDAATVRVEVDGIEVPATAKPLGGGPRPVTRTAVLVMDVSGSMKQTGLAGAKKAAAAFLAAIPADVRVGLVTFGDAARVAVAPTTDRAAVADAVSKLKAAGNTALYDGTILGVATAGTTGLRTVLVLSDGADQGSRAKLRTAVAAVRAAKVTLDAVSFVGSDNTQARPLQQLATAGGGRVIATGAADDLAAAFTTTAQVISNQLEVTATLPPTITSKAANVTVIASAGGVELSHTAFTTLINTKPAPADNHFGPTPVKASARATLVTESSLPIALGALFLGVLVLLVSTVRSIDRSAERQGRVRRRLSLYTLTGRQQEKEQPRSTALGSSPVARSAVEFAGRVAQQRDFEATLALRLEAAGVPLRVAEWMLIHIGVAVGLAMLLLLVSGGGVLATVAGLVLGLGLPWLYLRVKEARRTAAFLALLPDTLQMVAGSLSAGFSMPQAMDTVVREGQQPITGEFNRALVEARLGVPIDEALDGVATRMKSKDFGWVVMAIKIQREVGGNLAELLSTVAATLRERERLRRQVKVLSAEGRLSAWILGLLPPVFSTYLLLTRPDYLRPLWTTAMGVFFLVVGVVLLTVGALWMRKAVSVEV